MRLRLIVQPYRLELSKTRISARQASGHKDTSIPGKLQPGAFCDTCCIEIRRRSFLQLFCKHTSPREHKSTQRHDHTHILGDSEEVPFRPRYSRDTAAFRPLDVGESTATKNGEANRELRG